MINGYRKQRVHFQEIHFVLVLISDKNGKAEYD